MVKNGFDESTKNLAEFRTDVNERFEQVDKNLHNLKKEVTNIGHKVNQIDKRLFSLEEDIYKTKRKQHEKLETRVSFIERKLEVAK